MSSRLLLAILAAASALALTAPAAPAMHATAATHAAAECKDARLRPGPGHLKRMRAATICVINRERAKRGLRQLERSDRLTAVASAHSLDMVKRKYFGHAALRRPRLAARLSSHDVLAHAAWKSGEIIAWGTRWRGSPRAIVALWMSSPGHRANILNPAYREVGAGIALGNPVRGVRGGATYTTKFFSKR